jgi:chromosomal replication initiation ATPase DnaA
VICRGNQRQVIFHSDADWSHYLERLEHCSERYQFKVYMYVLMSTRNRGASATSKVSRAVHMIAAAYGVSEKELSQRGCQRKWVRARSLLVYVGREWGKVSVKKLGRRLQRDPSIISPLYSTYAADRDSKKETLLVQKLHR